MTGGKTRRAEWPSSLGDGVSENPLFVRPIVRDGDRYAVAAPRALLMALCNALIRLAKDAGVTGQLAANYAESPAS